MENHIELLDVDVNGADVVVELLEFLFSIMHNVIPHRFLVIGEYFVCVEVDSCVYGIDDG